MKPRLAAREQRLIETGAAGLEAEKNEECQTTATETEEETIWREACTKGFHARGMMGLLCTRHPYRGKDTAYKSAKLSQAEKLAFRKARAQKQYDKIRQEKARAKAWENIDRNRGRCMPYPVIVEAEGGNGKLEGALV